ncbi:PAS domain S-box protein [Marinobacterium rhizophilum]|uniref:histidine kinase n=1 Tax=Marinobacterium rhizophilum TaxID=420402 RepID=A0ABY5HIP5_9GAMM|nr:PAS domain S-box protein [Marinobacterium rhizophilum]UTW12240.1 PAS domain S-box protein [Marinobacterium rhizophilum]
MQAPEIPGNERHRLAALERLQILDTAPQERFDRLTRLAKKLFQVPIALVSLVDADRQWFKSRQGLDACETPRNISFCGHAILHDSIFHVPDTHSDARFSDNPLVTLAPGIRMYAGAPLRAPDGLRVGTLCIIDDKPRRLDQSQLAALRDLADCVERELAQAEYETLMVRLSEAESYSRAVMDHVVDGIMTLDAQGIILDLNPAVLQMFGCARGDLLGRAMGSLLVPLEGAQDSAGLVTAMDAILRRAEGLELLLQGQRPDGSLFPLEVGIAEVSRRSERNFVLLLRDITRRHGAEKEQKKYAVALERLHTITTSAWSFERKVDELLLLGRDVFELPLAIVSRIEAQDYQVEFIRGPEGAPEPGTGFALGKTYCVHCLQADAPLGFHRAGESEIRDHPCYQSFGLEAYIGAPLLVDGLRYGTLNFSGLEARSQPFGKIDFNLIQLFSRWVGNEISRHRTQVVLRHEIAHRTAILDSANFSIMYCDLEGVIRSFNRGAQQMLGYSAQEVVGQRRLNFVHDANELAASAAAQGLDITLESAVEVLVGQSRSGTADEREWTYVRRDGSRFTAQVSITSVRDDQGEVSGYVCIGADISERKRIDAMKSEFISTVSHELRTPLTSISGSLGLIGGGVLGELPEKAVPLLAIARKNSERLIHLINDLLDIEKISAGKMQFDLRTQDVSVLVSKALEGIAGYATTYDVSLMQGRFPVGTPRIWVDEQRIQQILANYLSNAIKFSPPGSEVQLHVDLLGAWVRLSVEDQGIGIAAAFRPHVFEKFAQADGSDTKKTAGTGLGLAICKELAEHMGGQVGFESQAGCGSLFYAEFPLADRDGVSPAGARQNPYGWPFVERRRNSAASRAHAAVPAEPGASSRVLHVRDAKDQTLQRLADRLTLDVEQAYSIEDARARLQNRAYDLVILDIGLADQRMGTLLPDIQAMRDSPRVMVLTAEDSLAPWLSEVDTVLVKSRISEQDLGQCVRRLLQSAQA